MYPGEEIVHTTASENLSIATGWLFLLIALGSVLTFTFFAAISTSFYCCQKPIKKDEEDTNLFQKLFFPNVPSSVYPTTQSILQQEDNEVIDSLTPAYRELPSTHLSFSFNGSITIDPTCDGDKHTTTLPNSTNTSIQHLSHHTTSISSEKLITSQSPVTTTSQPSPTNPELINDSSLSIHIAVQDPQLCLTSSTSGILTEEDTATEQVHEPAINDQQSNEPAMDNESMLNEPEINEQRINEPNAPAINNQRLCSEICGPIEKSVVSTNDCSRGASTFGGVDLNPRISNRAFSPDYYALTFRREGSGLSDVSSSSLRGASAFAPSDQRRSPIMMGPRCVSEDEVSGCERGASAFGGKSERSQLQTGRSSTVEETEKQPNTQSEISSYVDKSSLNDGKITHSHSFGERIGSMNFVQNNEGKSTNLQSEKENLVMKTLEQQYIIRDSIKFPSFKSPACVNTRANSKASVGSCMTNVQKDEKSTGIATGVLRSKSDANIYQGNFVGKKVVICNNSDIMSTKIPTALTNIHTPSNSEEHGALVQPITTVQNEPRDVSGPMIYHNTKVIPKTPEYNNLNTTYQSLRGASHLGDDDVDSDAFLDSVSLSFAYESPEEDIASHFEFKEN